MSAGTGRSARLKGNNFELKISKQLTAWANNPNVKFTRSPGSGSWVSSHGGLSGDIAGDIATEALWPFSMELKNHESFTSPGHHLSFSGQYSIILESEPR